MDVTMATDTQQHQSPQPNNTMSFQNSFDKQEVQKHNSHVVDELRQLKYLSEASQYSLKSLTSDVKSLKDNVKTVSQQLDNTQQVFRQKMTSFVKSAQSELKLLDMDLAELEELRVQMASYFCEDVTTFSLDDCISTFHAFTQQFIRAVDENQKRREMDEQMEQRRRQREQQKATKRARSAQRGFSTSYSQLTNSTDALSQTGSTDQLQLPAGGGRRLSVPERQLSCRSDGHSASVSPQNTPPPPRRTFHPAGCMSLDVTSSTVHDADDLVQFLMNSTDDLRAVSCTPPRHRRRSSKTNLVVDSQMTERERTPSPCLSVPSSDVASLSPVDVEPVRAKSRTRRASRHKSPTSVSSLRSSSSTGHLHALSLPLSDSDPLEGFELDHQMSSVIHKSGSEGDLLDGFSMSRSLIDSHVNTEPHYAVSDRHEHSMSYLDRGLHSVDDVDWRRLEIPGCNLRGGSCDAELTLDAGPQDSNQNNSQTSGKSSQRLTSGQSAERTSAMKQRLRQLSEQYSSYDTAAGSSSSVSRSKPATKAAVSALSKPAGPAPTQRDVHAKSMSKNVQGCISTRQGATHCTTQQRAPTSMTTQKNTSESTSISADSEKLLKEFDALKKLKMFTGLGRHGRKSTDSKSHLAADTVKQQNEQVESKASRKSAAKRTATRQNTSSTAIASAAPASSKQLKSGSTISTSAAKRPVAPSARAGNVPPYKSTAVGPRQTASASNNGKKLREGMGKSVTSSRGSQQDVSRAQSSMLLSSASSTSLMSDATSSSAGMTRSDVDARSLSLSRVIGRPRRRSVDTAAESLVGDQRPSSSTRTSSMTVKPTSISASATSAHVTRRRTVSSSSSNKSPITKLLTYLSGSSRTDQRTATALQPTVQTTLPN